MTNLASTAIPFFLASTVAFSPAGGDPVRGAPNDQLARGQHGAVVAAEPHAARAGLGVLRAGGNAVDAAVATALALAVTHPQAGNLGGGGFMLIRMADGRAAAIDFREKAPGAAGRDMYLRDDGSVDPEKSLIGATAAGVPGSPAGLLHAHQHFGSGKVSLQRLADPAIELAEDGFEVDHFLAGALFEKRAKLGRFAATREVFFDGDRPLGLGERLIQRDLAETIRRFAEGGFDGFYKGETAERIVRQMRNLGGYISRADLAAYRPAEREPLVGTYRGYQILGFPPPSSGGVAVQQMLNILEHDDLSAAGHGSARATHLIVEAMRRAYADRSRWLGDPDFYPVPVEGLVAKGYAKRLRATIADDRVAAVVPGSPAGGKESDDTTHFSVVDADGNAVTCTTTINSTFGAALVAEGLGFFWNNEMDDFSAKPGTPNQFGLVGGEANAIAPGKRMLSSMTPTMVLRDSEPLLVLGSPGGGRIINTVLQVILNVVDFDLPLREAVAAPRIHHQWLPEHVSWERLAVNPDVQKALEAIGHRFAERPRSIGRCQAIRIRADGTRVAVSDPRSGGTAVAF